MLTDHAPRAMAVDPDDPRHQPNCVHLIGRLAVFIDGEPAGMVIAYDIDASAVVRAKVNAEGNTYVEPGTDEFAIETVHGSVTVELLPA